MTINISTHRPSDFSLAENQKQKANPGQEQIDLYRKRLSDTKFNTNPQKVLWLKKKIAQLEASSADEVQESTHRRLNHLNLELPQNIVANPPQRDHQYDDIFREEGYSAPRPVNTVFTTDHKGTYATNEAHFYTGREQSKNIGNGYKKIISVGEYNNSFNNEENTFRVKTAKRINNPNSQHEINITREIAYVPNKQIPQYIENGGSPKLRLTTIPVMVPSVGAEYTYHINKNAHISAKYQITPSMTIDGNITPEIKQAAMELGMKW